MSIEHIAVTGGDLVVEKHSGNTEPVLLIHGVSSQRTLWGWLRAESPHLSVIAPDLRGRGDSAGVDGPSSLSQHADDLDAVLAALGHDAVHVCGMSMGGFVAVEFAARYPERVKSLVLVDGGIPATPPVGATREDIEAMFADKLERTQRQWDSVEDYVQFLVSTSLPLLDPADPLLREYAEHDLVDGSVRLSPASVISDAGDVFFGQSRFSEISVPVRLLYAEWSIGADSAPMYSTEDIAQYRLTSVRLLPETDHAGTVMTHRGAEAVAAMIDEALPR